MSHLTFYILCLIWIFAFSNNFCHFYLTTFVHSKCKRSSLHSQYWIRQFLSFSNTVVMPRCNRIIPVKMLSIEASKSSIGQQSLPPFYHCLRWQVPRENWWGVAQLAPYFLRRSYKRPRLHELTAALLSRKEQTKISQD